MAIETGPRPTGPSARASFRHQLDRTISGREVAQVDWAASALGEIEGWPRSLLTLVSTVLACPTPMFLAWGPDLRSFFNDAYRPLLGQRLDGAMGRPFEQLWRDLWGDIGPLAARTLAGESIEMIDTPLDIRRDGSPEDAWWTFTYSPVRDDHDAIAGLLCVKRETTEKVRADRNRVTAARRLQTALSIGDAIGGWVWDVADDRLTCDAPLALFHGVDPDHAGRGMPMAEFQASIHPDDLPLVETRVDATLRFGDDFDVEYRITGGNGEVQWVAARGRPVFDGQGRCVQFTGESFDITINKTIERARSGTAMP